MWPPKLISPSDSEKKQAVLFSCRIKGDLKVAEIVYRSAEKN
jgi:hypothetical protein